ncbi:MAG TPA: MlaD family protein [Candidatus Saccharimonadales bacterium]|nr:MlaD family protein [Candidatus Saccharimonadales bacterium]
MKRSGDIRWGQVQIGVVVVGAALFLLWAALRGGDAVLIGKKKAFRVQFKDVKGLVVGAPVRLNGLEVGQVESISLDRFATTHTVEVRASVNRICWPYIRRDSEASIAAISFFGDKFLQVTAGSPDQPQVPPEGEIRSVELPDPMEVISGRESPLTQMGPLITSLDSLAARTERGEGSLGRTLRSAQLHDELVGLARDLRELSRGLLHNQEEVSHAVVRMGATVDSLGRSLEGGGSVGRALHDPALYDHLASAAARLDSLTGEAASGRGTLGKLARDEQLYNESQALVRDMRKLLQDMQANPRKYIKISIF